VPNVRDVKYIFIVTRVTITIAIIVFIVGEQFVIYAKFEEEHVLIVIYRLIF